MLINDIVDLPDEQLILRLGVASRSMGKAGTVQLDLDLPSITRGRLQLAGPVIGLKGASPAVLNAVPITSVTPFQPVTERSFRSSDVLNVLCHATWTSGAPLSLAVRVVSSTGSRSESMKLSGVADGRGAGYFEASLPLADLPSGAYVLEVLAKDADRTVLRQIPISVR